MSSSEAVPPESENETPSQSSAAPNVRLKTDAAWEYAIQIDDGGKRSIQCVFCQKIFSGGGISRFKYHLMGIKGDVSICKKVLEEVRDKLITLHADKAKAKSRFYVSIDSEEVEMSQPSPSKKRAINSAYQKLFKHGVRDHSQVSIKAAYQTASSSGCERNWSTFDWIHSKRRNRLEHQRLNDLVYIHYNLRLRNRCKRGLYSYDPVDYESIDKTEFWIVEQEPEEDIGVHELETMLEEAPICVQEQTQDVGEDILATGEIAMCPEANWENENWLTQSLPREES